MELMHRFGGLYTDEYMEKYLKLIKDNPGSGDVVWFATHYGYPKLEQHEKTVKFLTKWAKVFRENGIKVHLQISNTLGHGEYMSGRDCSGLYYEGCKTEFMVGPKGESSPYSYCWNGKNYRKYIIDSVTKYAEFKPDVIWIDDDFRAVNHSPVGYGCFCDDCIAKFNKKWGCNFKREELVESILHSDDITVRKRWIEFIQEGLADFMEEMLTAFHKLSPDTNFALQSGIRHGAYIGGKYYTFIFDVMKKISGKMPLVRSGGGSYLDHNPNTFFTCEADISYSNAMCPDYMHRFTPEVESLPFKAFGKSPEGNAYETSLYFATGNTDCSYSIMMNSPEVYEWYNEIFVNFSKCRKYWERLTALNPLSYQAGIRYYLTENIWTKKLSKEEGFDELNDIPALALTDLYRDGFPIAYDRKGDEPIFLHAEQAKGLSDEDIEYLLTRPVVCDGESVAILGDRLKLNVKATKIFTKQMIGLKETFVPHTTLPEGLKELSHSVFGLGRRETYWLKDESGKAEIIGYYASTKPTVEPFTTDKEYPLGLSEIIVDTGKGAKWAILGYSPWRNVINVNRRNQIYNIIEYISGRKLASKVLGIHPLVIYPRKDKEGKVVCVSIVNPTISKTKPNDALFIANPKCQNFEYMAMYSDKVKKLKATKVEGGVKIAIPEIPAWQVATIFCEK